jgi:cytochrome c oxidase subunit 2
VVARGSSAARAVGLAISAVGSVLLLGGCSVAKTFDGFGWPDGITKQSHRMYDLWIGSVVAALAVGFFVWGLIFWCVVRYRKRGEHLPPQTRYNMPLELIYSITPFLVISVLFYYTVVVQNDVNKMNPNPDVVVQVQPSKWNWSFIYPGTVGPDNQPVRTVGSSEYIPVLVVPTNKLIQFDEHSPDVIHSFWVPDLLFKRDVFPGNVENKFQTTITVPGAFVGRCAELCGTYHSMMNFELRAVSPEKFEAFLAAKKQGMSTPDALTSIGEKPFASTTTPFDTKRTAELASN